MKVLFVIFFTQLNRNSFATLRTQIRSGLTNELLQTFEVKKMPTHQGDRSLNAIQTDLTGRLIVLFMDDQIDSLQIDEHFEMRKLFFGALDKVHHFIEQVNYVEFDSFDLELLKGDDGKPEEKLKDFYQKWTDVFGCFGQRSVWEDVQR